MLPANSLSPISDQRLRTGRFAPSPTGPLHFGSLLAAVASYLDCRSHQGRWLVRIEDLDPPREDPNAVSHILRTLESCQLEWDGPVRYQSQRHEAYATCLEQLRQSGLAFPCSCSRKQLANGLHHGICIPQGSDCAWRFLSGNGTESFEDTLQGEQHFSLDQEIGDFVIRRRDQLWSYQLAVVCDDIDQGITHVMRGIDLIDSTPRQQLLYRALAAPIPVWSHIPVAVEHNGQKLSKQNLARALNPDTSADNLWLALLWLRQEPPLTLRGAPPSELLSWAIQHWQPQRLSGYQSMPAPAHFQLPV